MNGSQGFPHMVRLVLPSTPGNAKESEDKIERLIKYIYLF